MKIQNNDWTMHLWLIIYILGKKNLDQLQCGDIKAEASESGTQIKKETSAPEKSPKGATGATGPVCKMKSNLFQWYVMFDMSCNQGNLLLISK